MVYLGWEKIYVWNRRSFDVQPKLPLRSARDIHSQRYCQLGGTRRKFSNDACTEIPSLLLTNHSKTETVYATLLKHPTREQIYGYHRHHHHCINIYTHTFVSVCVLRLYVYARMYTVPPQLPLQSSATVFVHNLSIYYNTHRSRTDFIVSCRDSRCPESRPQWTDIDQVGGIGECGH